MTSVKYTCPDIDAIINKMRDAEGQLKWALKSLKNEDYESARLEVEDALSMIEEYASKYNNPLEDIRSSNTQLRDNWQECETSIIELNQEIDKLISERAPNKK